MINMGAHHFSDQYQDAKESIDQLMDKIDPENFKKDKRPKLDESEPKDDKQMIKDRFLSQNIKLPDGKDCKE